MHDQEIFHQYFGPFSETTFAILEDNGESFRLSFDQGPEYNALILLNNEVTAFKFLAGTIGEIRVTFQYGKKLSFQGRQIPTFAMSKASIEALPGELEPVCSSIHCPEPLACPDESKPVLICPGGEAACSEGEG